MDDSETSRSPSAPASAAKKPAKRRKSPAASAKAPARRTSPRRKSSARSRPDARARAKKFLTRLSARAEKAGSGLASLSEEGVSKAWKAFGKAGGASRKAIDVLAAQWKQMDRRKRARLFAALIAALAAASAPIVSRQLRKK